jgi:hypothetical protein
MDITLGPWRAEMSVDKQYQPLAEAMAKPAWETVKNTPGFEPKEAVKGEAAKTGFTISGKLTNVIKDGNGLRVFATFTILLDGTFVNVQPVKGDAIAIGEPPVNALIAVTEDRITKILKLIKAGSVKKAK